MQNVNVSAVKNHASILAEHLARYGIKIKRTQALEVISNLQGQTDWNRVKAKLMAIPEKVYEIIPPGIQPLTTMVLVGRPGVGKTETLKTFYELEKADGTRNPVFICFSGSADLHRTERDDNLSYINRWDIHYSESGITTIKEPLGARSKPHVVNMISDVKGSRRGLKDALSGFLLRYLGVFQASNVGSLLLDDFHGMESDDEADALKVITWFSAQLPKPLRYLVIATQVPFRQQYTEKDGLNLSFLVEDRLADYYRNLIVTHRVSSSCATTPFWRSESIDDSRIFVDIYGSVMQGLDFARDHQHYRANGESRLMYVKGDSLWFKDLRSSTIR